MTYAVARRQQQNVLGMQIPCSKYAAGYAADLAGYVTIPAKLAVYLNRFVLTRYIATGNYAFKYRVVNAAGYICYYYSARQLTGYTTITYL